MVVQVDNVAKTTQKPTAPGAVIRSTAVFFEVAMTEENTNAWASLVAVEVALVVRLDYFESKVEWFEEVLLT